MTEQKEIGIWDTVEKYKYAILYYVYFATCLVIALLLARPGDILSSLI